jgi:hypothetical protein
MYKIIRRLVPTDNDDIVHRYNRAASFLRLNRKRAVQFVAIIRVNGKLLDALIARLAGTMKLLICCDASPRWPVSCLPLCPGTYERYQATEPREQDCALDTTHTGYL